MYFAHHIFCCTNARPEGHKRGSCIGRGGGELKDYFKKRCKEAGIAATRVNASGCLDRCELGPVVVIYPEGVWYRVKKKKDVDAIVEQHLLGGTPVESLRLRDDER